MGAKPIEVEKTGVVLLRPGVGRQDFHLPAGATLGDLFRAAEVIRTNQDILIDGKSVEDTLVLHPGAIITIVPRPNPPPSPGSWREGIGMFRDDPTFPEFVKAMEESREAEKDHS